MTTNMSIKLNPEGLALAIKAVNAVIERDVPGVMESNSVAYADSLIMNERIKQALIAWVKYSQIHGNVILK